MKKITANNWQEAWDRFAEECDERHMDGRGKKETDFRINQICKHVAFSQEDFVLDIGPGSGGLFGKVYDKVKYCWGIDPGRHAVERLKRKFWCYPNIDFKQAFSFKLPFPDNYLDKVVMNGVFHYLEDMEQARKTVREIARVLKKEGIVFFGEIVTPEERGERDEAKNETMLGKALFLIRKRGIRVLLRAAWRKLRVLFGKDPCVEIKDNKDFFMIEKEEFSRLCEEEGLKGDCFITQVLYGPHRARYDFTLKRP